MRYVQLTILNILIAFLIHAQDTAIQRADSGCIQKDLPGLIRAARHKPPKPTDDKSASILLIPIIGSNPATGFMVGVGGQYAFKEPGPTTNYSLISGSIQFTTKNQKLFLLKNTIYTKNNNIFFSGDWRYLVFSQATYGLGTNAPQGGIIDYQYNLGGIETADDSLAQPLHFNFIRFYQSVCFRILKKHQGFYAGIGYNLDYYFKIKDEKLRLNPGDSFITSHYSYNKHYGFDTAKYYASTLNVNLVYDTRDNIINAYKGHFALLNWRGGFKLLGNKTTSNFIYTEWRSYHPLSARNPRHLLAFWFMGEFTPEGEYPYLILSATGYDQRGRSGRGYTQGRFRGNNLVYGEAEYRFPISQCGGVLGGVLFANATTANNPLQSLNLFESIKPGYGGGLRIMVDKKSRTNLAVDVGFGYKSFGFYLAASETF